jgi:hypothetical protein
MKTIKNRLVLKPIFILADGNEKQIESSHLIVLDSVETLGKIRLMRAAKDEREPFLTRR